MFAKMLIITAGFIVSEKIHDHGKKQAFEVVGIALARIEHGIGTENDKKLIDALTRYGEDHIGLA